ncbi:Hypothetical protein D9617_5g071120 [Elsinoe fawcettii]|nr:Hypothetical protein D9617_5g071120 [Elsinoe fawcettii]
MGNDERTLKQRIQAFRASKEPSDECSCPPSQARVTSFNLCKENDLPHNQTAEAPDLPEEEQYSTSDAADSPVMTDSTFGVQSLNDALEHAFPEPEQSSARSSPLSRAQSDLSSMSPSPSAATSKKRKAGNPVHPRILAAGQRIISSESSSAKTQAPTAQLRMPTSAPTFQERLRTMSSTSVQTPSSGMGLTPNLDPIAGLTPGSGSPRSVRLSDDDAISFDDSASQAILSSSGDEDDEERQLENRPAISSPPGPQLVMPSLLLPARRKFSDRGKQLGRLRMMVTGQRDAGARNFSNELLESCEHIVHVDEPQQLSSNPPIDLYRASTKPQKPWTVDGAITTQPLSDSSEANLEYNLSVVNIAGSNEDAIDEPSVPASAHQYIEGCFRRLLSFNELDESDIASILIDGGAIYPDIVYYVLHHVPSQDEAQKLAELSHMTNMALVMWTTDDQEHKTAVRDVLDKTGARCIVTPSSTLSLLDCGNLPNELQPAQRSALLNDMASDLFHPVTIQKLRHSSTQKFLAWRRSHAYSSAASPLLPNLSNLPSDLNLSALAPPTHTCSTISSPSGVLVPYPDSSFYRPFSPSLSGHTIDSASRPNSALALATLDGPMHQPDNDIKEVRLAQWALDLQKSLEEERRRQASRWTGIDAPIDCTGGADGKRDSSQGAVVRCTSQEGRLCRSRERKLNRNTGKSQLSCTDAFDPLGIIRMRQSFKRNGIPMLLRIVGIGGAIGTIVLWASQNWDQVRDWFGWPSSVIEEKQNMEYAMGWQDAKSWRAGYDAWGLKGLVDRVMDEVGRLRPIRATVSVVNRRAFVEHEQYWLFFVRFEADLINNYHTESFPGRVGHAGCACMANGLRFEDYTVAWIAVLPIEAEAALGVLDVQHEGRFPSSLNDDYLFIGGEINGHNVVVATWPTGQNYGTSAAAALAGHIKARFPNLWFSLLVGVAAGVPNLQATDGSQHRDIRLGDVLVCVPEKDNTGVVQYDLGVCVSSDEGVDFTVNGRQAETIAVVRSAVGYIKLTRRTPFKQGQLFAKWLEELQSDHDDGHFDSPPPEEDVLFCTREKGAHGSTRTAIDRKPRPDNYRSRVWYGKIGSGNMLVRSARKRDMLRDQHDIIGLEMEAAGVMNILRAGVIRGVCDYADGQKDKKWQPYAAAVAAVYAKGILTSIDRRDVRRAGTAATNNRVRNRSRSALREPSANTSDAAGVDSDPQQDSGSLIPALQTTSDRRKSRPQKRRVSFAAETSYCTESTSNGVASFPRTKHAIELETMRSSQTGYFVPDDQQLSDVGTISAFADPLESGANDRSHRDRPFELAHVSVIQDPLAQDAELNQMPEPRALTQWAHEVAPDLLSTCSGIVDVLSSLYQTDSSISAASHLQHTTLEIRSCIEDIHTVFTQSFWVDVPLPTADYQSAQRRLSTYSQICGHVLQQLRNSIDSMAMDETHRHWLQCKVDDLTSLNRYHAYERLQNCLDVVLRMMQASWRELEALDLKPYKIGEAAQKSRSPSPAALPNLSQQLHHEDPAEEATHSQMPFDKDRTRQRSPSPRSPTYALLQYEFEAGILPDDRPSDFAQNQGFDLYLPPHRFVLSQRSGPVGKTLDAHHVSRVNVGQRVLDFSPNPIETGQSPSAENIVAGYNSSTSTTTFEHARSASTTNLDNVNPWSPYYDGDLMRTLFPPRSPPRSPTYGPGQDTPRRRLSNVPSSPASDHGPLSQPLNAPPEQQYLPYRSPESLCEFDIRKAQRNLSNLLQIVDCFRVFFQNMMDGYRAKPSSSPGPRSSRDRTQRLLQAIEWLCTLLLSTSSAMTELLGRRDRWRWQPHHLLEPFRQMDAQINHLCTLGLDPGVKKWAIAACDIIMKNPGILADSILQYFRLPAIVTLEVHLDDTRLAVEAILAGMDLEVEGSSATLDSMSEEISRQGYTMRQAQEALLMTFSIRGLDVNKATSWLSTKSEQDRDRMAQGKPVFRITAKLPKKS